MVNEQEKQAEYNSSISSDNPPVDMSYIQACIGDDKERELELVKLFIDQADICLKDLQKAYEDNDDDSWRKVMHLLKGSAANMGAQRLSDVCKAGENSNDAKGEAKKVSIKEVQESFSEVKLFFDHRK